MNLGRGFPVAQSVEVKQRYAGSDSGSNWRRRVLETMRGSCFLCRPGNSLYRYPSHLSLAVISAHLATYEKASPDRPMRVAVIGHGAVGEPLSSEGLGYQERISELPRRSCRAFGCHIAHGKASERFESAVLDIILVEKPRRRQGSGWRQAV